MFDIGIQELVIIFAVALIVFGPGKMPELARMLGKAVGHARRALSDMKTEMDREMNISESLLDDYRKGAERNDRPEGGRREGAPSELRVNPEPATPLPGADTDSGGTGGPAAPDAQDAEAEPGSGGGERDHVG